MEQEPGAKEVIVSFDLLRQWLTDAPPRDRYYRSDLPADVRIVRVYQEPGELTMFRVVLVSAEWPPVDPMMRREIITPNFEVLDGQ